MSRPPDWSPLRGSDPTPGDPQVVGEQARHFGDVAAELRAQVSRLRRIGGDGELRGEYADRLRSAAEGMVGDLQRVEQRYERVAAALRHWEPQLRDGQDQADRIRLQAQELDDERRALHREADTGGEGDIPDDPTRDRISRRLDDVEDELRRLDRELSTVEERVKADGRAVGAEIRSAVADDIEDTTWEDIKGLAVEAWRAVDAFIDRHIDAIRWVVEVLQYAAMALAVVALFIPGLNLLVAGLTIGMFLTQGVLYASGNSSFTDLALATLSLVTLGTGQLAGAAIARAFTRTRAAVASQAGRVAAAGARAETRAAREALGRRLGQRLQPSQRAQARAELDRLQARTAAQAERRAATAERDALAAPVARARWYEVWLDGGVDNARYANDIAHLQRQFPQADILAAGHGAGGALHVARSGQVIGAASDGGTTIFGESDVWDDKPYSEGFEDFKQRWDPLR
jgi:hypothetical protein